LVETYVVGGYPLATSYWLEKLTKWFFSVVITWYYNYSTRCPPGRGITVRESSYKRWLYLANVF
jgi:hypothetical protein